MAYSGYGSDDEDIINFTPYAGFNIWQSAQKFADLMIELQKPLAIHFEDYTAEFEIGCSAEQIVDGYNQVLNQQMGTGTEIGLTASNSNSPQIV